MGAATQTSACMTAQLSTELVWNNAQSVYEGHGEWRLTVYTLLPNSDPLPPSSLGAPLVFRSVSPECQCWDAGRDLGSRFEAGETRQGSSRKCSRNKLFATTARYMWMTSVMHADLETSTTGCASVRRMI
ncbi:predicted protein [Plenodomus lingam JN3]|uniref:Predicted protein n=1 Tax=Leptosphaeria maculans (strain JN3 / isolate v23.1.3 / race Av1-4-5-6-7-8) TaxID=985895 RepID=E5AB78_LEPMJ|nr:predicted protein [Plenodomus lingam JN3]CBY00919.1 predicted protein [Plenodomus lingam JN3]